MGGLTTLSAAPQSCAAAVYRGEHGPGAARRNLRAAPPSMPQQRCAADRDGRSPAPPARAAGPPPHLLGPDQHGGHELAGAAPVGPELDQHRARLGGLRSAGGAAADVGWRRGEPGSGLARRAATSGAAASRFEGLGVSACWAGALPGAPGWQGLQRRQAAAFPPPHVGSGARPNRTLSRSRENSDTVRMRRAVFACQCMKKRCTLT